MAKYHGDRIQARYLALAGIEKAKALLYQDAIERKRNAKHHSGALYNAPEQFRDIALGRGRYRVFRQGDRDETEKVVYGIRDEERFLNLNTAGPAELGKLEGMTPDIIAAIQDWRDGDNSATPGGAETDYYAALQPPSLPRNGALETTRELLMVRGVSRTLFAGEDTNLNGLLDPEEDDGDESEPPDNRNGLLDMGWSGLLTVNSASSDQNAAGEPRINIKSADEKTLASVPGLSADLARAIVAHRNRNQFETLADLLEVTAPSPQDAPRPTQPQPPSGNTPNRGGPASVAPSSPAAAGVSGPRLISEDLLMEIADDLTAADNTPDGLLNINTASAEVLACLPGLTPELGQAIVAYRRSAGFFPNIAWLLKVDGVTRAIFKQVEGGITARSETFRILCEGNVPSTHARQRLEVIVRLSAASVETLAYREEP